MRWVFLFIFILFLTACDTQDNLAEVEVKQPQAPVTQKPEAEVENAKVQPPSYPPLQQTIFMQEPTTVHVFETTAEALSVWRRAKEQRPTLLLLSNNPHLQPVPEKLRKDATDLINNADLETIRINTSDRTPSPLLLPDMVLDVAMRNNWFREVVWALPLRDPDQELDLERFQSQLTSAGVSNKLEVQGLSLNEKVFKGTLKGTSFQAATLPKIKGLNEPVIVHIDLSYFRPLYKNEISTSLLDIVFQTLVTLKKMQIETMAVTFSYGHLDSQIALDVRFLGDILVPLIEEPARMGQNIPANWQRQSDALYLVNFFKKDKIRELYIAQEQDAPDKAWVKYNLYRSASEHKEGNKALDYLAQAVKLDPMYALEYFELSNIAYERNRPDESLRMLGLAAEAFPGNPFIKIHMARLADELGKDKMAIEFLKEVRDLEWANIYYPQMPQDLSDLMTFIQTGSKPNRQSDSQLPIEDNSKKENPRK